MIRRALIAMCLALVLGSCVQSGSGMTVSLQVPRLGLLFSPTPTPDPSWRTPRRLANRPVGLARRRNQRPVRLSPWTTVLAYPPPPIQARAAILVDTESGRVLYSKDPDRRLPMASTTKITTAILALHHSRLTDVVTVSDRAARVGESTMSLRRGERVTVLQLLYGLVLNSGNDAAVALAEHVAGTEARFVAMMNGLARALHMHNTHYVTAHGLDAAHHYSSARDLAIITRYALRDAVFRRIVATTSYHIRPTRYTHEHWLASVNYVMYWYPGVDGVKPGDTDAAGLCQVVSVNRDGHRLLAVLLNTPTLVVDVRNLLNFGLHDFRWIQGMAWWDGPGNFVSGGRGADRWVYYEAAGHYVRGLFLAYFNTHGGLHTLGYPRTEQLDDEGQVVQFFQGGELVYDPQHHSVYPSDLGLTLEKQWTPKAWTPPGHQLISAAFGRVYKSLGGLGVLGAPVSGMTNSLGCPAQFFQFGALALIKGSPFLVPIGDAELRRQGWFPTWGGGNIYSPNMMAGVFPVLSARSRPTDLHRQNSSPAHHVVLSQSTAES